MTTTLPESNRVYQGDCLEIMRQWPDHCIDHCIADPPFNISAGGGRKGKKGLAWAFSSHVTIAEEWDRFGHDDFFKFNVEWLREVCRVVKPNGNIFVFGTYHNIYQLGFILQSILDRRINNSIIWFKPNAQPNITARTLTESTEQIIWAVNETPTRAANWVFNYRLAKELSDDKQMRTLWALQDVISAPVVPPKRRLHPSQKPGQVIDRLVRLATRPGEVILDAFAGSGAVALSALRYRRSYVLIELLPEYATAAQEAIREFPDTVRGRLVGRDNGLAALTEEELDILTETPVPQADDLDLVFKVPQYVQDGAETRNDIAGKLDYAPRQGPYYADAAIALRLVDAVGPPGKTGQKLELSDLGERWLNASDGEKLKLKRQVVLAAPIVRYIAGELDVDPRAASGLSALQDQLRVAAVLKHLDLSEFTALRRAKTLCEWFKAIAQIGLQR
jgi:site-specific DNA-methyltransferase (adenine-specific)